MASSLRVFGIFARQWIPCSPQARRWYVAIVASTQTVPINVIGALAQFAEDQGWSAEEILAGAGISPMLLKSDRARVTEDQLVALVRRLWRMTDDEIFGIGRYPVPRGTFRLLCYGLVGAKDMRGALERLAGFLRALPAFPLEVDIPEEGNEISIFVNLRPRKPSDQLSLVVGLGSTARLLAWMLRRNLTPTRIELPFSPPANDDLMRTLLDAPVVIDSDRAALIIDSSWLGCPIMRDESDIEDLIAHAPRGILARPRYQTSVADQVRGILEAGIRNGELPHADEVATRLNISQQTLRRRLADEGTSTRELTEAVRRDAAISSLVKGEEAIATLSQRLGFSEQSTFARAFRQWTGSTPGAYRRQGHAGS